MAEPIEFLIPRWSDEAETLLLGWPDWDDFYAKRRDNPPPTASSQFIADAQRIVEYAAGVGVNAAFLVDLAVELHIPPERGRKRPFTTGTLIAGFIEAETVLCTDDVARVCWPRLEELWLKAKPLLQRLENRAAREPVAASAAEVQATTEAMRALAEMVGRAGTSPTGTQSSGNNDTEHLTPEVRAILFVRERLKTTGKLPKKTEIAEILDVNRRTLNNWTVFKVAYANLLRDTHRQPVRGSKAKDGTMEAWRESGK